jgi:hypothetical protein
MMPTGRLDRRRLLTGLAATSAALACPQLAMARGGDPAGLLPATADQGLHHFMRMFSGLREPSVFANEGLIYGKLPGELPRRLRSEGRM